MGFSSRAEGYFPYDIRDRGSTYHRQGRVKILAETSSQIVALVSGTSAYEVVLDWKNGALRTACTCPYFEGEALCKHIWATILSAEKQGFLSAMPRSGRFKVLSDSGLVELPEEGEDLEQAGDEIEVDDFGLDEANEDDDDPDGPEDDDGADAPMELLLEPVPQDLPSRARASPNWRRELEELRRALLPDGGRSASPEPPEQILYVLDREAALEGHGLVLHLSRRKLKKNGEWSRPVRHVQRRDGVAQLRDPADRSLIALLFGPMLPPSGYGFYFTGGYHSSFVLPHELLDTFLPAAGATGRFYLQQDQDHPDLEPISWDGGPPWELRLRLSLDEKKKHWLIEGYLMRGEETMELVRPTFLTAGGFVFAEKRVARFNDHGLFPWVVFLRQRHHIKVPVGSQDELLQDLLSMSSLPPVDLPEPLRLEEIRMAPGPQLTLRPRKDPRQRGAFASLDAELGFLYAGELVRAGTPGERLVRAAERRFILRDLQAENAARELLLKLGLEPLPGYIVQDSTDRQGRFQLIARKLPRVVRELTAAGWHVEADGKLYRRPGELKIEVSSGVDWFDLDAEVDFDGQAAKIPALLAALRRGEDTVVLGDGTLGILPESWLKKYAMLLGAGAPVEGCVRFKRSQIGFLDALLAAQPEATFDAGFKRARAELRAFDRVKPMSPEGEFQGELRPYQKDGMGWMDFLRRFGFGGCLADDMGLGKTVQVLALLESRRAADEGSTTKRRKEGPRTSLIVVPRSLVFNWKSEAARFTPRLRILDHTGMTRLKSAEHLAKFDLAITTYGTLRRDVALLKDVAFDYVILDEGQAIKNSGTESAKAVRLLKSEHRLVLSGTPIENHLGELWSLFEFLNPGMLGAASAFKVLSTRKRGLDEESLQLLQRALKPFILRRTKQQVAKDLPERNEQTIHCDLGPEERQLYDELRTHYRASLLGKIESDGMHRSKIQVLEALLRLRQAACHPGLVDKRRRAESSAKLELLLEQLADVREEGHKALVFSQFTSLLAIVRAKLDRDRVVYEYLDGQTRDRAARVERFQTDASCGLFLVSLKAGGLGLNLTAADYVFLLDPWWNPAVEAQAIDRAHRIGQRRNVFAYRIVARDTVEEKVLELQETKRRLADAIINADNSLIRDLTREDLERLLS